jgi:hypothetical protein
MNTYGLHSINNCTFNIPRFANIVFVYPKKSRDVLVTFLKVHNFTLNILGYIPGVSVVSGCVRMGTGLIMCAVTLAVGERNANQGVIIGRYYDEALLTGITQIARGALEAFVPSGWVVNASLDAIATIPNLLNEAQLGCSFVDKQNVPHSDPKYPFPFSLLHLA